MYRSVTTDSQIRCSFAEEDRAEDGCLEKQPVSGARTGQMTWPLAKLRSLVDESVVRGADLLELRYYASDRVVAASVALPVVCAPPAVDDFITFRISDLRAAQLRKGMFFNPDPYVKITVVAASISAASSSSSSSSSSAANSADLCQLSLTRAVSTPFYGYAREFKTFAATNTCFPVWKNESFVIVARSNDLIVFEVKDKFARTKPSINRFLGRALVDVSHLVDKVKTAKGWVRLSFVSPLFPALYASPFKGSTTSR